MVPGSRTLLHPLLTARVTAAAAAVAAATLVGCSSESRPAPGAETCLGALPGPVKPARGYGAIGLPNEEPDLQAWVVKEQSGLLALTTRPCQSKPPTRLLRVPADAKVLQLGHEASAATLVAGQRIAVWFAGGSTGTARAVLIERAVSWPPAARH